MAMFPQHEFLLPQAAVAAWGLIAASGLLALPAVAQDLPVTAGQKATAVQVAQAGVPLSELAPNAPDNYTVKNGDTLWAISGMYLKSPWRWPELWGMNMAEIRNPHRIYPGQQLFLERLDGRATLRSRASASPGGADTDMGTVRVSPRVRSQSLADNVIPTLKSQFIDPFLAEPLVVDEAGLSAAPRIIATQEGRVLLSRGDRAYARGPADKQIAMGTDGQNSYRIFRNAIPLKDPGSGEVLGYEAQYVGKALVVRGESKTETTTSDGKATVELEPATIDIVTAKEEMRVGDRLLPEPERALTNYTPHAPASAVSARVVSIYGSAVANAAENQVIAINRGTKDGLESGHVLALQKAGLTVVDKTSDTKEIVKLPNERHGLAMVFRTFDRVSYALILGIGEVVRVGDSLVSPR
jgi:LysM domain